MCLKAFQKSYFNFFVKGPFTKANCNAENVTLFVNTLEALVETCLPVDEAEEVSTYDSLLSVSSNVKLSSSLTSISLASPTEKGNLYSRLYGI